MDDALQTTFSNATTLIQMFGFRIAFHWNGFKDLIEDYVAWMHVDKISEGTICCDAYLRNKAMAYGSFCHVACSILHNSQI